MIKLTVIMTKVGVNPNLNPNLNLFIDEQLLTNYQGSNTK